MSYNNYSLKQLQAIDAAHHLHPFTDHRELRAAGSRMIVRAEGPYIYDSEGNEILDGMAGLWCVNVGYGRDELADAAAAQMKELPYYNSFFKCSTPTPVLLAQKLAEIAPKTVNQVFFGSSGSESNDTALRLVRHYWALEGKPDKNIIVSRKMAYHGSTVAGTSLGGMEPMHKQLGGAVPNIVHVMAPYAFELAEPGEDEEAFGLRAAKAVEDAILAAGADKVAAFIGEPIMGAGGVKIPPKSYWPEIQRICRKHDVLLMLDEVITGYGRTGEWFAAQTFGVEPDTITTAKALTSGYMPLSALLVGDRIAKTLVEKGGEFNHGYTYSGHPVACAVALANIGLIREMKLVEHVHDEVGPYLAARYRELAEHPLVGDAETCGLMGALLLVKDKATGAPFPDEVEIGMACRAHCFREGLIMRAVGDRMIIAPPLVITRAQIDEMVTLIRRCLDLTLAEARAKAWR